MTLICYDAGMRQELQRFDATGDGRRFELIVFQQLHEVATIGGIMGNVPGLKEIETTDRELVIRIGPRQYIAHLNDGTKLKLTSQDLSAP